MRTLPLSPEMKLSSSYSLLKFVYLTGQCRHFLRGAPPPKKNPGSAAVVHNKLELKLELELELKVRAHEVKK